MPSASSQASSTLLQSILGFASRPISALASFAVAIFAAFSLFATAGQTANAQVTYGGLLSTYDSGFVTPSSVAPGTFGNVFVTDLINSTVSEVSSHGATPVPYGSGFKFPQGVATDSAGNIYIADTDNNAIKELILAEDYATVHILGSGFNQPFGLAVDPNRNIFVADTTNQQVKEIGAATFTSVTVLASGFAFNEPESVALDAAGNVYVADRKLSQIVEITAASGYANTVLVGSGFTSPRAVAADSAGNLFVLDKNTLKEVTVASGLTVVVPLNSNFNAPAGLALDSSENVFIADENNSRIAELALGAVDFASSEPVGQSTAPIGLPFVISAGASIGKVSILTMGVSGGDFADAGGSTCAAQTYNFAATCQVNVKFTPSVPGIRRGAVVIYDASGNVLASVPIYGTGSAPQISYPVTHQALIGDGFNNPDGIVLDGNRNAFIVDGGDATVWENPAGGGAPIALYTFSGSRITFNAGIAIDGSGNLFVLNTAGFVFPGSNSVQELFAATGYSTSRTLFSGFTQPTGIAIDGSGNLFVTDSVAQDIIEITAASGYSAGTQIATQATASGIFYSSEGVTIDGSGNLFVVAGSKLWEITAASRYTSVDLVASVPNEPKGLAADPAGNIYVAATQSMALYKVTVGGPSASVSTLGGVFINPGALAIDSQGDIYVADYAKGNISTLTLSAPPGLNFPTPTPVGAEDATDGPATIAIDNEGNAPLLITAGSNPVYPIGFPADTEDPNLCKPGESVPAGGSCDLSFSFNPTAVGATAGKILLIDNALNVTNVAQYFSVAGTGVAVPTTLVEKANSSQVALGYPIFFTASVAAVAGTASGTVNFLVDGSQTAKGTLVNGIATVELTLPAGKHAVEAVYPATGNFLGSSGTVTVIVANVALTVTGGSGQTAAYGSMFAAPLSLVLKNSSGQPLAGQTITFVPFGVTLSSSSQVTDVNGNVSVFATAVSTGSLDVYAYYDGALGAWFPLSGIPAPLTVTAGNLIVLKGQAIPKPTYAISGLANGDSPTVLGGAPAFTVAATSASPAGVYPITVQPVKIANPNYQFLFLPGTLTIAAPTSAATIAISSGSAQTAKVGTALATPLSVLVRNASGQPVSGAIVTFIGNGITTSQSAVLTNASGLASVVAIPNRTGAVSVIAQVNGTALTVTLQGTGD
jgi:sugar lactone lactonase YvrE